MKLRTVQLKYKTIWFLVYVCILKYVLCMIKKAIILVNIEVISKSSKYYS